MIMVILIQNNGNPFCLKLSCCKTDWKLDNILAEFFNLEINKSLFSLSVSLCLILHGGTRLDNTAFIQQHCHLVVACLNAVEKRSPKMRFHSH